MKNDLEILSQCLKFAENLFSIRFLENPEYDTIGKKGNSPDIIRAKTPKIISLYKASKKDLIKNSKLSEKDNSSISEASIEFVQLLLTIIHGNLEQHFLDQVISELKSTEPKDYYGIKCELSVYQHYKTSGFKIRRIPEESTITPDFELLTENESIYIECKSILSESIKHTPRLDSFLKKLMSKIKDNILINIVLDSKDADKYEPEVEELFDIAIIKKVENFYSGEHSKIQLIKPKTTANGNSDFVIPNFNPSNSIGSFNAQIIDGKMVGAGGVNFLPFFPNDYKKPLAKILRKANSQIDKLGKGILHVQFPSMKVKELLDFIYEHGHRIHNYIETHSLLAVVINIPYLKGENGKSNHLIPNINIPYFKSSSELQRLALDKPFWLNNYSLIETIEKGKILECEFSLYNPLGSFVLYVRNSNLDLNIKFFIINNQILYECIVENTCCVNFGTIPKDLIKESNKLKLIVGEVDAIYLNDKKLFLNKN